MLELRNVDAGYLRGVKVLHELSIRVSAGEVVCLIGPNGAGKSTVLRVVSGLLRATAGTVELEGTSIRGVRPDLILRMGVTHVPQGHSSFPGMSVHENLLMGGYSLRDHRHREARIQAVYESFPLLRERRKESAGNLSGGEQKILEIGRALIMEPRIMLLDEPSLGLAPKTARLVFETIRRLNDGGLTVLMVEQNARSGMAISDRAYVLELGRERLEGPADELLKDSRVGRLYLGGDTGTDEGGSRHFRALT